MPNYTILGFPYPDGAESVASLDDTGQELAEALDAVVGRHAAGTVSGLVVGAGGGTVSVPVSFPADRFTAAPVVVTTLISGIPNAGTTGAAANAWAWASSATASGFTMNYRRGAADTGIVAWMAVQL